MSPAHHDLIKNNHADQNSHAETGNRRRIKADVFKSDAVKRAPKRDGNKLSKTESLWVAGIGEVSENQNFHCAGSRAGNREPFSDAAVKEILVGSKIKSMPMKANKMPPAMIGVGRFLKRIHWKSGTNGT